MQNRFLRAVSVALALAAAPGWAQPAEQHRAGLEAYQRGDVRGAISILRKPADEGHAPSQALIGYILDVAEENEQAVRYFEMAARQGDAEGLYGLATMQAVGEGTPRDPAAARAKMMRAADLGHRGAINAMATAHMTGGLGLSEDERRSADALKWIQRAAASDLLPAVERMAAVYRHGEFGLAADPKKAEEYEAQARKLRGPPATLTKKRR